MLIPFLDESFVVYCDYYSLQVNMIAPKFSLFGTNQGGENNIFEKVYVRTEYFRMIIRMIVRVSVAITWMSCLRWQLDSGDDMISQDPSCQGTHRHTGSTGSSWRDVGVTTSKRSALKDKKLRKRWE